MPNVSHCDPRQIDNYNFLAAKILSTPRNYDCGREAKMDEELTKLLFGEAGVDVSK